MSGMAVFQYYGIKLMTVMWCVFAHNQHKKQIIFINGNTEDRISTNEGKLKEKDSYRSITEKLQYQL